MRVFLSLILLISTDALGASSLNQQQAQVASRDAYADCVNNALNGVPGCGSFDCTGANQAFDHVKSSYCIIPIKAGCQLIGWGKKSKDEWIAIGARKMAIVGSVGGGATPFTCTGSMITSDLNAQKMEGVAEFQATDTQQANGSAIDGGSSFGLEEGEMLDRMHKGESLHDILASSPYFQSLSDEERNRLLAAADDPDSVLADTDMTADVYDEKAGGSGNGAAGGAGKPGSLDDALAGLLAGSKDKNGEDKDKKDLAGKDGEDQDGKNGRGLASDKDKNGRRRYSSLERTIFDIVHAKYVKKMPDIVDIDQYIKKKAREKPIDIKAQFEGNQINL
jgi:hypothetical protein